MAVMHQCIPTTKVSMKSNVPWINRAKALHARNLSFKRVKITGRVEHQIDYKKKVANMIKNTKLKYFKLLNTSNPKKLLESG